ncbi:MAG: hypothetical protein QXJ73_04370, partial [Candidatus Caldarchaeum sp.]
GPDLLIDLDKASKELVNAFSQALLLAVNIAYVSPETLPTLLVKASREASALAVEAGYYSSETVPLMISKAVLQATALAKATASA